MILNIDPEYVKIIIGWGEECCLHKDTFTPEEKALLNDLKERNNRETGEPSPVPVGADPKAHYMSLRIYDNGDIWAQNVFGVYLKVG